MALEQRAARINCDPAPVFESKYQVIATEAVRIIRTMCYRYGMKKGLLFVPLLLGLSLSAMAQTQSSKTYRWVDDDGVVHFGDSVPAKYSEKDKDVLNKQGVAVDFVKGKITEEELAEIERRKELAAAQAIVDRENRVLLATYQSEEEITMHRDRRLELIEAQAQVTNLYLTNLKARMLKLDAEAKNFRPFSDDPDAPPVPLALSEDREETRARIQRYDKLRQNNLDQANAIRTRFDGDLKRFQRLRGGA